MKASIDHGEVIASNNSNSISFEVPSRATYARVTASKGEVANDSHDGEQWAWTQPFWVSVDGVAQSKDPRHETSVISPLTGKESTWHKRMPHRKRLVLELYDEQAGQILRHRSSHQTPRCLLPMIEDLFMNCGVLIGLKRAWLNTTQSSYQCTW